MYGSTDTAILLGVMLASSGYVDVWNKDFQRDPKNVQHRMESWKKHLEG